MLTFPSGVIRSASLQLLRVTFVIAVSAIAVSALLIPGRAFADPPASGYTITDLGAFYPTGINNSGQVTGTQTTGNVSQAVIWNQGTITPLPFLPGGQSASASAIGNLPANASSAVLGEVVGQASDSAGHEVGTYWLNGGTATGRGGRSCYSVDEAGDIAGQVFKNDFVGDLFIYAIVWKASGTILRPLGDGTDGVISSAEAINNNGDIAGWFNPGTGASSYGYLQTSTGRNYDLRLADDTRALARAVNDNQVTVGESSHTGSIRGFVFTPDPQTITALPPLAGGANTSAYSVNKSGDIVGYAQRSDASTGNILVSHATKWVQLSATRLATVDLNDLLPTGSGWSNLSIATGINDSGSIIGTGTVGGGTPTAHTEAFLLTPPPVRITSVDTPFLNSADNFHTFVSTDPITLTATVSGAVLGFPVHWTIIGDKGGDRVVIAHGTSVPTVDGVSTFTFTPAQFADFVSDRKMFWTGGSPIANTPIAFEVIADVEEADGKIISEANLAYAGHGALEQDETDTLRQEYVDFAFSAIPAYSDFIPSLKIGSITGFNKGNYSSQLDGGMIAKYSTVLAAYRGSKITVNGTTFTIPSSAGIDISSGYRNPQRNVFVGSKFPKTSKHTLGYALDLVPQDLPAFVAGRRILIGRAYLNQPLLNAAKTAGTALVEEGNNPKVAVGEANHIHIQW